MDWDALHETLGLYLPATIGLIVAVAGIGLFLRILFKTNAARAWPTTLGILRRAELDFQFNRTGDADASGTWVPIIEYDYEVNGTLYTGTKIAPAGDASVSIKSVMEARIAPYTVGDSVEVRYNPRNPQQACLEIEASGLGVSFCVAAFGLVFAAFHIIKNFA